MSDYIVDDFGTKHSELDGKLHSFDDRPAMIFSSGEMHWYKHGKLHRDGGRPSVVNPSWMIAWHVNGELHRGDDLPAIIFQGVEMHWYKHGKKHRDGGLPAYVNVYARQWWVEGRKLRLHLMISTDEYLKYIPKGLTFDNCCEEIKEHVRLKTKTK